MLQFRDIIIKEIRGDKMNSLEEYYNLKQKMKEISFQMF